MIWNGWTTYNIFMSLRCHFTQQGYNFLDYVGRSKRVSTKPETFGKMQERFHFEWLSKQFNNEDHLLDLLVPCFVDTPDLSIWDLIEKYDHYKEISNDWMKRRTRSIYHFNNDIRKLFDTLSVEGVKAKDFFYGGIIFNWLVEARISMETFILLDKLLHFSEKISNHGTIYSAYFEIIVVKYSMILNPDMERYAKVFEIAIKDFKKNQKSS